MKQNTLSNLLMMGFLVISVVFTSCTNEEETNSGLLKEETTIKVLLPGEVYRNVNKKLNAKLNKPLTNTNGNSETPSYTDVDFSEEAAQEILQPLVVYGIDIRDQLIEAANNNDLSISDEELEDMQNMDDSQLAALAYFTFSLTGQTLTEDDEDIELDEDAYTWKDIKDCLFEAVGRELVFGIQGYIQGTKTLMTATTALQIARGFITRTLGWIGVAYSAYKFGRCLHNR